MKMLMPLDDALLAVRRTLLPVWRPGDPLNEAECPKCKGMMALVAKNGQISLVCDDECSSPAELLHRYEFAPEDLQYATSSRNGNGHHAAATVPAPYDPRRRPPVSLPSIGGSNGQHPATVPAALAHEVEIAEWEAPISLDRVETPAPPVDVLPGALRSMVEVVTECAQTPSDLAFVLSLASMSICTQGKFMIEQKPGVFEPTNLYVLCPLPPSSRKSYVFGQMTAPFTAWEQDQHATVGLQAAIAQAQKDIREKELEKLKVEAAKEGEANREHFDEKIASKVAEIQSIEVPVPIDLFIDNCTAEALTTMLGDQEGIGGVMSAEGDIFQIMGGRYSGSPNIEIYKKAYSGDPVKLRRQGRRVIIPRPALTMAIATQPSVLAGLTAHKGFREEGLLARFFYAVPDANIGRRDMRSSPVPEQNAREYADLLRRTLDIPWREEPINDESDAAEKVPYMLRYTEEAQELWYTWAEHLERARGEYGRLGGMQDWAGKLEGGTSRLAANLHVFRCLATGTVVTDEVDAETVADAIKIAEYLIEHAIAAFGLMGQDEPVADAKVVLEHLRRLGEPRASKQEIWQSVKGNARFNVVAPLDAALAVLCERGYLQERLPPRVEGKAGRNPAPYYLIHPSVARGT